MKMMNRTRVLLLMSCLAPAALADVPQTINHQGVIRVQGNLFSGTGQLWLVRESVLARPFAGFRSRVVVRRKGFRGNGVRDGNLAPAMMGISHQQ
jgi:hypothetical protein